MKKKLIYLLIVFIGIFILVNFSNGWTYLKVNGEMYVLNSNLIVPEGDLGESLGSVKMKFPKFLKPLVNNASNDVPYGTEIYKINKDVAIKYKNKYYVFTTTKSENWGNGMQVKLDK